MGHVHPSDSACHQSGAETGTGIDGPCRKHAADVGAEMPADLAGWRGSAQPRHCAADRLVASDRDRDASRLRAGRGGGDPAAAKTPALATCVDARVGAEDSRYDLEDQAAGCDPLECAHPGPASRCEPHARAWGLATLRGAAPSGREIQTLPGPAVRREGAGHRGLVSASARPGFGAVRG